MLSPCSTAAGSLTIRGRAFRGCLDRGGPACREPWIGQPHTPAVIPGTLRRPVAGEVGRTLQAIPPASPWTPLRPWTSPCHRERSRRVWRMGAGPCCLADAIFFGFAQNDYGLAKATRGDESGVPSRGRGDWGKGGFEEHVSEVLCVVSCGPPCDEIPVFTGMTKLEYGTVPHNSGENRNPMDRDSGGLNITKQALETRHYNTTRRQSLFSYQ